MGNTQPLPGFRCTFPGNGKNSPISDDPKNYLLGLKMGQQYINRNGCTLDNRGATIYDNGEFTPDGRSIGCLHRDIGGNDDICGGECNDANCHSSGGCCHNAEHPRFRRTAFLADKKFCLLTEEGTRDRVQKWNNGLLRTCDPDWYDPNNEINKEIKREYCATALLSDPLCKSFCAQFPDQCTSLITQRCNTADALSDGICNDLCNTKPSNSNVEGACSRVIANACSGNDLNNPTCQKLCFDYTTNYDCKNQLTEYCSKPENQDKPLCACFLPPNNYQTFYGRLFAGVADPAIAYSLQSQAQALPQCSYPPCSTQERFKPRVVEMCPSQQTCVAQITNTAGVIDFQGNQTIRQDCKLMAESLNKSPAAKAMEATHTSLAAGAPTRYASLLADTNRGGSGILTPADYANFCIQKIVIDDVSKPFKDTCVDAVTKFCGDSTANMNGVFCKTMCAVPHVDLGPINASCSATVNTLCQGKDNLGSDACKNLCFSETTTYDCTAKLEEYCSNGGKGTLTDPICECHQGKEYYAKEFVELWSHAKDGAGKTLAKTLTVDFMTRDNTGAARAAYDYVITSSDFDCWNSAYYPRSMNPPAPEYQASKPEYDCIVQMEVSEDLDHNETLVYHGDPDKDTKVCEDFVESLNADKAHPDNRFGRNDNPDPGFPVDPAYNPKKESGSGAGTAFIVIVVAAVLFLVLRRLRNKSGAEYAQPDYAPPGYAQPGYAQPGYAQPGYAQPGYAQPAAPAYAQPGFAQPVYAQPGY